MALAIDNQSVTFRTLSSWNTYSERPGETVYVNLAYVVTMYRHARYTRLGMVDGHFLNVVEHPEAILQ